MAINLKNYNPALMAGAAIDSSATDLTIDDLVVNATGTITGNTTVGGTLGVTGAATFALLLRLLLNGSSKV